MRQYETGLVLSPALSEEETNKFLNQITEVITQRNGRLIRHDFWGKRKLAYPIKHFNEGFYSFFTYESEGDVVFELERRFRQSDTVLRYLTVKIDYRETGLRKRKRAGESAEELGRSEQSESESVPAAEGETGEES